MTVDERRQSAALRLLDGVALEVLEDPRTRAVVFSGAFTLDEAVTALKSQWIATAGFRAEPKHVTDRTEAS